VAERARTLGRLDAERDPDDIIHFGGASWEDYERVLAMRGDASAPRIHYLEGALEIMAPSRTHEDVKSVIACLVEQFCLHQGIRFTALGSWTLKKKPQRRGAEADECYQLGDGRAQRPPELAIEVEWSHGRIDKLDIYRKLGVREVWIWRDGAIACYRLRGARYVRLHESVALRGIDLAEITRLVGSASTYDAIRAYQRTLTRGR
jgi:Uma2 family endonuclease